MRLFYGLFDDGTAGPFRVPFTGYKVGAIAGPEIWDVFGALATPVLDALEQRKTSAFPVPSFGTTAT